jgi:hypothetical protein
MFFISPDHLFFRKVILIQMFFFDVNVFEGYDGKSSRIQFSKKAFFFLCRFQENKERTCEYVHTSI